MKKLFKKPWLVAFLLSLALGCLIVVPNIILGGKGIYTLFADLNIQQIPFNKMINNALKSGEFLWTWQNDLGSNFIGTFSFYNLFSPFNIIGYLFPADWFPYLLGPIFILKYGVAGLTSYLFLKRYVKNPKYAIIGSLLYTFSGFQLTNILFYHFHDVVAFFPLLLYTLDNLVYDNKKGKFALAVALCAFTNWFFFIGQVVFLGLYYLIKILTKEYKFNFKKLSQIIIEGLLGTLMAAIVLLPSCLFTLGNPRVNNAWNLKTMVAYDWKAIYLELIQGFIYPPQVMNYRSIVWPVGFFSNELYLPVVGSVLAFAYITKNYKKWESILLIILFIFMLFPILNSVFFAFTTSYYARWFYMPILIMSLASIRALEDKIKISKGLIINGFIILVFGIAITERCLSLGVNNFIFNQTYFYLSTILMLVNILVLILIGRIRKEKIRLRVLIIMIFITVSLWGNYMVYIYKGGTFKVDDNYYSFIMGKDEYKLNRNERANGNRACFYNSSYLYDIKNIYSWNSNINSSAFEMYYSLGLPRDIQTIIDPNLKSLNDFLGIKYFYICNSEDISLYGYKLVKKADKYDLYENPQARKIGFILNDYISQKEFAKESYQMRREIINNKIILTDKQIKKYGDLFKKKIDYESSFAYGKNSFTSNIKTNQDALVVYTIPYDKGWKAKVNNKEAKIEKVDMGMMAIKVPKGTNKIKFSYFPYGLKLGLILTGISLVGYILYRKSKFFF